MNNVNVSRSGFVRLWRDSVRLPRLRRGERLTILIGLPAMLRIALQAGLLWFGALVIRADTHYVSLNGTNDVGHSYSNGWAGAATNIQWAVNAAQATTDGDTVLVSNGTYNLTNQIRIASNITVRSFTEQSHGSNDTFINGNYPAYTNRCVYMSTGVLDGFTISNGFFGTSTTAVINDYGGGVKISGGSMYNCYVYKNFATNISGGGGVGMSGGTVSNCTISSNTASSDLGSDSAWGGGVRMTGGLLIDSYISGNTAYYSGGAGAVGGGRITNCTIAGNTAKAYGGGMRVQNTSGIVGNCIISNNTALSKGGAYLYASKIINSIIINNKALGGGGYPCGGISIEASSSMSNCQVIGNSAVNQNGGVYINGAGSQIANCIIANNYGNDWGGGLLIASGGWAKNCLIYNNTNSVGAGVELKDNAFNASFPYSLINCTIVNNSGASGAGIYMLGSTNYIENCIVVSNVTSAGAQANIGNATAAFTNYYWHTCTPNVLAPNQGNITSAPMFVDRPNYNFRLGSGSPCINTGTNMEWMMNSVDLDGRTRIRYGTVDMGAYEAIYSGTIYGFR